MQTQERQASSRYRISRSSGKKKCATDFNNRFRVKRKAMGNGHESDDTEPDEDLEPGAIVLHKMLHTKVVLYPNGTVVKSGPRIAIGEAEALKVVACAGLPVPRVHDVINTKDIQRVRMDYVPGDSLDKLWPDMTEEQRQDIAQQLGVIVSQMRYITPPPNLIGVSDGTQTRDTRHHFTYHSDVCKDEAAFNNFTLDSLFQSTPRVLREAFAKRLQTNHRSVLSHCDLTPRNIIVKDGENPRPCRLGRWRLVSVILGVRQVFPTIINRRRLEGLFPFDIQRGIISR